MGKIKLWIFHKLISSLGVQERRQILTVTVKKLFNTINSDDILKEDSLGQWIVAGKAIDENRKKSLIAEAGQFIDSDLWKILRTDIRWQANRKMYLESTHEDHLVAGKLWQFTLDAFTTRLKRMADGKGTFN